VILKIVMILIFLANLLNLIGKLNFKKKDSHGLTNIKLYWLNSQISELQKQRRSYNFTKGT
jgi:hypothetical protein